MSESKRQQKFSRLLQKELSEIFQRDIPHLFKNTMVTVTDVRVSPDLSVAKAFLSFMLAPNQQQLLEVVNERKSEVRNMLGRRIRKEVRHVPELVFFLNESADYAAHMDRVISNLDIPPAPENEEEDEKE
ncbi:ribosome-binding factor A [Flammeovirgaceae bacterium 311]|nr:ribosome-binding factor A [Flammeovirgaceae bacterium 311]